MSHSKLIKCLVVFLLILTSNLVLAEEDPRYEDEVNIPTTVESYDAGECTCTLEIIPSYGKELTKQTSDKCSGALEWKDNWSSGTPGAIRVSVGKKIANEGTSNSDKQERFNLMLATRRDPNSSCAYNSDIVVYSKKEYRWNCKPKVEEEGAVCITTADGSFEGNGKQAATAQVKSGLIKEFLNARNLGGGNVLYSNWFSSEDVQGNDITGDAMTLVKAKGELTFSGAPCDTDFLVTQIAEDVNKKNTTSGRVDSLKDALKNFVPEGPFKTNMEQLSDLYESHGEAFKEFFGGLDSGAKSSFKDALNKAKKKLQATKFYPKAKQALGAIADNMGPVDLIVAWFSFALEEYKERMKDTYNSVVTQGLDVENHNDYMSHQTTSAGTGGWGEGTDDYEVSGKCEPRKITCSNTAFYLKLENQSILSLNATRAVPGDLSLQISGGTLTHKLAPPNCSVQVTVPETRTPDDPFPEIEREGGSTIIYKDTGLLEEVMEDEYIDTFGSGQTFEMKIRSYDPDYDPEEVLPVTIMEHWGFQPDDTEPSVESIEVEPETQQSLDEQWSAPTQWLSENSFVTQSRNETYSTCLPIEVEAYDALALLEETCDLAGEPVDIEIDENFVVNQATLPVGVCSQSSEMTDFEDAVSAAANCTE